MIDRQSLDYKRLERRIGSLWESGRRMRTWFLDPAVPSRRTVFFGDTNFYVPSMVVQIWYNDNMSCCPTAFSSLLLPPQVARRSREQRIDIFNVSLVDCAKQAVHYLERKYGIRIGRLDINTRLPVLS